MARYFYALVAPVTPDIRPATMGIDGAPVRAVAVPVLPPCVAWVSDVGERPTRKLEHLAEHDAVTDAATLAGLDVIPARFGQTFDTDAALVAACQALEMDLRTLWPTITGCVEMSVTVRVPVSAVGAGISNKNEKMPQANSAGTGRAYLEARSVSLRAAQRARDWISPWHGALWEQIRGIARTERERVGERPLAVYYSHLVDRTQLHAYRTALDQWTMPGARVLVSGPHAPYSFALAPSAAQREFHRPASRP